MFKGTSLLRLVLTLCASLVLVGMSFAAHINTNAPSKSKSQKKVSESSRTRHRMHRLARSRSAHVRRASLRTRRHHSYERFHMSSFAEDLTDGDVTAGEDPTVRQGDRCSRKYEWHGGGDRPTSGRILAMVTRNWRSRAGRTLLHDQACR